LNQVLVADLRLGPLLAEGGEGRVYEVPTPPGELGTVGRLVYKQLRSPQPVAAWRSLVAVPALLAERHVVAARRVLTASAWPLAVVTDNDDPSVALGSLMPRAPSPFWLRHRDGNQRLATLSYLASDPDRIAVAYGVDVPPPGGAERVALVYALALLLDAWQGGPGPRVVHGDLSAKNVLWSVRPAPAVFVLDCDGARVDDPGTSSQGVRATTPNWDDPATPPGSEPSEVTDRYLLGLVFLRLVGSAHFPLQGRQRAGEKVNVDLELPRWWRKFPDMPGLWGLCERSLSVVGASERPAPGQWASALEDLLEFLGAVELAGQVRRAQGDAGPAVADPGRLSRSLLSATAVTVPDVVVRPLLRDRSAPAWQLVRPTAALAGGDGLALSGPAALTPRQFARRVVASWAAAHRLASTLVRRSGRRAHGLRRLLGLLVLDLAAACLGLFLVGMVVSPWIGL
jgi:hypothetical protein